MYRAYVGSFCCNSGFCWEAVQDDNFVAEFPTAAAAIKAAEEWMQGQDAPSEFSRFDSRIDTVKIVKRLKRGSKEVRRLAYNFNSKKFEG